MYWFMQYYLISGLIMFLWLYSDCNSPECRDAVADVTWNTGIKREHVRLLLYGMAILFGFIMLPFEIVSGIVEGVNDES